MQHRLVRALAREAITGTQSASSRGGLQRHRTDGKVIRDRGGRVHYLGPRSGLAVDGRDSHRVEQAGNEAIGARGLPRPNGRAEILLRHGTIGNPGFVGHRRDGR